MASVVLSWSPNPSTDNVTGYEVFGANGTGTAFGSCALLATVSALTWTDAGLPNSQARTYYIVAQNVAGSSSPEGPINITTPAPSATAYLPASYLDTDGTLAANSDTKIASQKATKTAIANAVTGLLDWKGSQDCSANPNYPAASKGDAYIVSVAGKIGGGSGLSVDVGDVFFALADNAGGTQAGVGASWDVLEHNLVGALLAANNLSDVASPAAARGNIGATTVGGNIFTLTNPSAITFLRVNADNSVSALSASAFRTAIGAGTGSGDLLSTNNLSDLSNAGTARTNLGLGTAAVDNRATTAQVQAGTASKVVEPDVLVASAAPQALTDGATISWDMSLGYNAKVTLGGSRTLAAPTNPVVGLTYTLAVTQDGTGTRLMTWPAGFDWGTTGAPTLTTTINKTDLITLFCSDAGTPKFRAFLSGKGFAS